MTDQTVRMTKTISVMDGRKCHMVFLWFGSNIMKGGSHITILKLKQHRMSSHVGTTVNLLI